MQYIDYKKLKEYYTIDEVCQLFDMSKADLKAACKAYNIEPEKRADSIGYFNRFQVRRLHNELYKAERSQESAEDDLWS